MQNLVVQQAQVKVAAQAKKYENPDESLILILKKIIRRRYFPLVEGGIAFFDAYILKFLYLISSSMGASMSSETYFAVSHIRLTDIQSARSRNENRLRPKRLWHRKGQQINVREPVSFLPLIQASGVDNGLCIMVAAKYHEQVGNHGSLPLFV